MAVDLRDLGYEVVACKNVGDALREAEAHRGPIDLLVTDVVMPGVSGRRLAEMLTAKGKIKHVLYISGHTERHIVNHGILETGVAFLSKPFTAEELARKVRNVLDGSDASGSPAG